jgi:hypothetical protein
LPALHGRFWSFDQGVDDDDGPSPRSSSPGDYRRSPSERALKTSSRYVKRITNRLQQRSAAMALSVQLDPTVSNFTAAKQAPPPAVDLKVPVLEPTVFFLEDFNAAEWTRVVRKNRLRKVSYGWGEHLPGSECRRSPEREFSLSGRRSRSRQFRINGPTYAFGPRPVLASNIHYGPQLRPRKSIYRKRGVNIASGLPAPIPRGTTASVTIAPPLAARVPGRMSRAPLPPNSGAPPPNPLRQPMLPGRTPVRDDGHDNGARGDEGALTGGGSAGF